MDQRTKSTLTELRQKESADAASWLMKNCSIESENSGDAFLLIPRLSWKRSDQRKLAQHYLSRIPYASQKPYEVFASIMSIKTLVEVIEGLMPTNAADRDLLKYHLAPVLRDSAKSDEDRALVERLLK